MSDSTDLPWSTENTSESTYFNKGIVQPELYSTDLFAKAQNTFTVPGPVTRQYDTIPSGMSMNQLFDAASNDGSTMGSSTFNESSASSSRIGTRQDSFSDIQSRKASLSSTYDSTAPERSPEVLSSARGSWCPVDEQTIMNHQIPHERHMTSKSNQEMPSSTPFIPFEQTITSRLHDTNLRASTSPTHLLHSRCYSAAAYFANHAEHPNSSSSASASAIASIPSQSLVLAQPHSSYPDDTRQEIEDKVEEKVHTSRGRSSTSSSTRKLKFRRSRTGCMVCRKRKVKCDQDGQPCKQCRIGKRECHYDDNPAKRRRKSKNDEETIDEKTTSIDSRDSDRASQAQHTSWDDQMLSPNSALTLSNLRADMEKTNAEQSMQEIRDSSEYATSAAFAREEDEELRRKTDALFAQHTNIDDVGIEEGQMQMRTGQSSGIKLDPDQGYHFSGMGDSRLDNSILSHTSMGSTCLSGTISDQTLDSSFETNFPHLSHHPDSSLELDLKHTDGTASTTFDPLSGYTNEDGSEVHFNGDGNEQW